MNQTDEYMLDSIKLLVWSGFYSSEEVDAMIDDILEEDADEESLRAAVAPEFARKALEEKTWPPTTDCDRLDAAFSALNAEGILALQNAGYTMSDGLGEVDVVLEEQGKEGYAGYCFYHGQDLERAVRGSGLMLAYGDLKGEKEGQIKIGKRIVAAMEEAGFQVDWKGSPDTRIYILLIDWKRRRVI